MIPIIERKFFYNFEEIFFIVAEKIKKYKCPGSLQTNLFVKKSFYSCENFFIVTKKFFMGVSQVGPGK